MLIGYQLPEHLEVVYDEYGQIIHGDSPYGVYIRNKRTMQVHYLVVDAPPLDSTQAQVARHFLEGLRKALKEQLNEDLERR